VGVGATVVTPFGPIGVDYALGLDARDELGEKRPAWIFHFKISQPGF
jgi:outer membrane translocation and assembly module TamA